MKGGLPPFPGRRPLAVGYHEVDEVKWGGSLPASLMGYLWGPWLPLRVGASGL